MSNSKATKNITNVGGATGAQNIANLWHDHFYKIYNSVTDSHYMSAFYSKIDSLNLSIDSFPITVSAVDTAIGKQKLGKACGPDGICMEAFIYGGHRLRVLLCLLFYACIMYGYLPSCFLHSAISPLVKCNTGDLTDVNNYRAIAIANSISKILESVLCEFVETCDTVDDYQFGFRKNHSTALCTHAFKQTVDYYTQRGSHVFACFIDFNKAFDNVNYWLLFCKMLDKSTTTVCYLTTRLLAYWYSHQRMFVRWQHTTSETFGIKNGVRQGGILSPFLFRFYIPYVIYLAV